MTHFVHGVQREDVHRHLASAIERYARKEMTNGKNHESILTPPALLHVVAQLVKETPVADGFQLLAVE